MNQELIESRHLTALICPNKVERPHVLLYRAVKYCAEQDWCDDGYACDYLADLCRAAIALLNMDSGRLDCARLDRFYRSVLLRCEE